jgi:4,5-dihydroxyphthalate decarboxylase
VTTSKRIRIAVGENLWTRPLVDGTVTIDQFPVDFRADATLPDRLHGVREGKWDGGDGTLTDYLLEKEQAVGTAKAALPIFMLGGFRQRTLLARRGGVSPKELGGKKVALPRVLTPGGVYMRGFLADEFGIRRDSVEWHAIHGAAEDAEWPWLKGRFNKPEGLEAVVDCAAMVDRGEFAALIHPGAHGFNSLFGGDKMIDGTLRRFPDLHQPLGTAEEIVAWFRRSKIYPVVHALQLRVDCLEQNPGLAAALLAGFAEAWAESEKRLGPEERRLIDRERELLNFDPYRYELGEVQRHTIEKLMDYLQADGLLKRRFTLDEIFHGTAAL